MLVIEPARGADVEQVVRMAPAIQDALGENHCWVARDVEHDTILGFGMTQRRPACDGYVVALAVDSSHRGQGLGAALMRKMREGLRQEGAKRMVLEVRAGNMSAQRFYQREGFTPEGLEAHAYPDGEDAIRYTRPL